MANEDLIDELWTEWEWEEDLMPVDDVQEEVELAARQVMEESLRDDPDMATIAGKLNRIYLLSSGHVNW